jgi:hypothetical protein
VVVLDWAESYRIVYSRYPFVGIFDRVADPADLERVIALEQRTNDRVRDDAGEISLVRAKDRIAGPGSTPIMGAFTHARPSRFSDGSFGTYYAARHLPCAVAESRFHVERFYRATNEPSADIDMRVYAARIHGRFDDLLSLDTTDARLDPDTYEVSQPYGRTIFEGDRADGIAYPSVRDQLHRPAVASFRPNVVARCHPHSYLLYRWDGTSQAIVDVAVRETLSGQH